MNLFIQPLPRVVRGEGILASLFGPEEGQVFIQARWPERNFHVHGPVERLPSVLRCPELRGLDALARRYTGAVAFGRGSIDARTMSADANACNLFKLGFTVYLSDIAAILPEGRVWLLALERELGVVAGCSKIGAFASPRGDGLPRHFDGEDVISVQLEGSKTFDIAKVDPLAFPVGRQFGPNMLPSDELYPQAGGGFPCPDGLNFERIRMEPGSVLFLPRGTWHTTVADSDSFSISVGIRPPAALDHLLPQLRALLLQDPNWRRPLYGISFPDARREGELQRLDALLAALPAALSGMSAAHLAPATFAEPHRIIELNARFQRIPMSAMLFAVTTGRLHLTVKAWDADWVERTTLETDIPRQLEGALAWLNERQSAFEAAEIRQAFPSITSVDLGQLLGLLCQSGYLRQLRFPVLPRIPS
jgi:hypothetical protein